MIKSRVKAYYIAILYFIMQSLKYPACKFFALLLLSSFLFFSNSRAQQPATSIKSVIAKVDTFNSHFPVEKLYLQFDKPYYAVGDTLWFKGYLVNQTLAYSPLSARIYVELVNDSNKVIKRMAFPTTVGITWGNVSLTDVHAGSYSIRAYTNWMRNFGQDYFFNRTFYVADPQKAAYLVSETASLSDANAVKMGVRFVSRDNQSAGLRNMNLRVVEGKKVIFKGTAQTTSDGSLDVNFPLPDKTAVRNLNLIAQDKTDNKRIAIIPVSADRARDVDVQFMPEGGYLVAGLPGHMGFKAIGDNGRGINITGKIINNATSQEVLTFESSHNGMGIIDLAPQTGDSYTAKITLPGGQTKDVLLPAVKASGTELRVRNVAGRDTMDVYVFMTPDLVNAGGPLYLVGQSRGVICFGATIPNTKAFSTIHVSKALFPTGIAHFTLLNGASMPVNERLTFIKHDDNLKLNIQASQKTYAPRDSVPLQITVNDDAGKPVRGSFSIAVTDDSQVKNSGEADNILSHLLLTSELKGYIEDPAFYFEDNKTAWQSLDALLLTQGWVGYDWKSINQLPTAEFVPEFDYSVNGKVSNLVGKGIPKADVVLLSSGKHKFVRDTSTNAGGKFSFNKLPPVDSVTFVLQARNAKHKIINAGITIDEARAPDFKPFIAPHVAPWYVNSDPAMLNYVKTNPNYHSELDKAQYGPQGKLLRTVDIHGNAIVKGSANLNGAGEADQVIDEETIENMDKTSLFDLLQQKVAGYRIGFIHKGSDMTYYVKDKKVHFVFDGVDVNRFYNPIDDNPMPNDYYNYIKQYLDYFTAEDIKGIEVLYSSQFNARYNSQNLTTDELLAVDATGPRGSDNVYLEITTRAGNGPFSQTANGIYVYKPMKLTFPKDFYSPKYLVKDAKKNFADLRSTIYWQPSIVTNAAGQSHVLFYAADRPATYTVILEGADLNGKIGYTTQKITVGTSSLQ